MQPTETYSVSRRALDVEDYIDILRRHKGWIFGPFLFALVASVVGGYLWPETFLSKGIIKVEPQQVPSNLVEPVMTTDMIDRIQSMAATIESRANLTQIVTTYNLYVRERGRLPLEDVVDGMRKQILIDPLGSQSGSHQVPAFSVSFTYPDRHQAQRVVAELMSKFTDANTQDQSSRTYETAEFLKTQTDALEKELEAIEERLATYKIENNGRLPEQETTNSQRLQSLETEAATIDSQISRAQGDKLIYESQLNLVAKQADEIAKVKSDPIPAGQQPKSARLLRAENDVEMQQNQLRALQQRYRDSYPDVKQAKEDLAAAETKRDTIAKQDEAEVARDAAAKSALPGKPGVTKDNIKEAQERETAVARLQTQIGADENLIEELKGQAKRVSQDIKTLEGRLDAAPQSEKEYDDLLRDRELKKQAYEDMNKSLAKAQVTQEMENRQEGEKLEILDPASLPESAASPNHPLVIGIGAGIGLMLGIVIAGAREMKDTSLKNLKDVRAYTQMSILGSIPLLENDFVVRRRRRLAWLGWTTACLAAVVLMSGSVVYYMATRQ